MNTIIYSGNKQDQIKLAQHAANHLRLIVRAESVTIYTQERTILEEIFAMVVATGDNLCRNYLCVSYRM